MWKHHHSAAGKGAEQSAEQPWPGRLGMRRLAGLFYCIQVYACRLGPHHVFGQG